jgi:hypothetical protein
MQLKSISAHLKAIFESHTEDNDFYDVDMFVTDIKEYPWKRLFPDFNNLNWFIRELVSLTQDETIYNWFGPDGMFVIFTELDDWMSKEFTE